MKVVIFAEVLGEANNGTTIAAYNLINYLKKQGHEVRVICPDQDKKGWEGYYILPTTDMGPFMNNLIKKNNMVFAKFDKDLIYEAVHDADVVHCMIALFISRKATKYIKSLGIPLTAGFHAQAENFSAQFGMLYSKLFNHWIYRWYDKNVFERADGIHYPTQFIRDVFEKEVKRTTPGYVISNGVNDIFRPINVKKPTLFKNKFTILFIGRLSNEKRHIVLMKAVAKSKYNDKIQLIFAGNGPKKEAIQNYARKHLKNQPYIAFMSRKQLVETINYVDLYCHPSYAEIEAISCLEAISCGVVPIIANSDKCATKEFALDDRSLFEVDNHNDLAKKIDYFIEHQDELHQLRRKYAESSIKYDQDYCMKQMEDMLLDVVNKHKGDSKKCQKDISITTVMKETTTSPEQTSRP